MAAFTEVARDQWRGYGSQERYVHAAAPQDTGEAAIQHPQGSIAGYGPRPAFHVVFFVQSGQAHCPRVPHPGARGMNAAGE
jgi:hypothetical protein